MVGARLVTQETGWFLSVGPRARQPQEYPGHWVTGTSAI